ncbi:MAG: hypothetical protein JW941_01350 [Candidatus Coatesbacteria bacterium]|nr:hypothetical protein [Candidatus Coatesbacteria bacterium]
MKAARILPIVLLMILLCMTISCEWLLKPDKDESNKKSESHGVTSQGPEIKSYSLQGPCERVFLEHPRQELTITGGTGTFFSPPDEEVGTEVDLGFKVTVEQNVGYKFVVPEGQTLDFTARTLA